MTNERASKPIAFTKITFIWKREKNRMKQIDFTSVIFRNSIVSVLYIFMC